MLVSIFMILTTKARYAIIAIVEIASLRHNSPTPLAQIASKHNIDLRYLEQIFVKLRKAGIVTSVRGSAGGYILAIDQYHLKIAEIIDAVGENIKMTRCAADMKCMPGNVQCKTHNLWHGLGNHIRAYFDGISVADVVNEYD